MQWSLQNIAKLKSSLEHVLRVHCKQRGAENVKARKTPNVGANKILADSLHKNWKQYLATKKLEPSTFRPLPHFVHFTSLHNGIPRPHPPPRPRLSLFRASTAALASRSRWTTESRPLRAAQCSGVSPREPRPEAKPQAEPKRRKEISEMILVPQVKVLKIGATQNPLWT